VKGDLTKAGNEKSAKIQALVNALKSEKVKNSVWRLPVPWLRVRTFFFATRPVSEVFRSPKHEITREFLLNIRREEITVDSAIAYLQAQGYEVNKK
jgi:hypothetical protein